MRYNFDDAAFKNKERGKYGNRNTYFPLVKKQFKIKEDVMFYTGKLRYLILVIFLSSFCFHSFAQVEGKKPVKQAGAVVCPCPHSHPHSNTLIEIYFDGLNPADYTIPTPNAPLLITGPPSSAGKYAVTSDPSTFNGQWLAGTAGHGDILICDGYDDKETKLFGKTVSTVHGNQYIFCAWVRNINKVEAESHIDPKVQLRIVPSSGPPVLSAETTLSTGGPWELLSLEWDCQNNVTQVTPEIWLTSEAYVGNDVGVDDISFVECKPQICNCDTWDPVTVKWTEPAPSGMQTRIVKCGDIIPICRLCREIPIKLTFKRNCKPPSCIPSYTWNVKDSNNNVIANGNATNTCNVVFNPAPGTQYYTVSVSPKCGDTVCKGCVIKIYTCEVVDCCKCLGCEPVKIKWMTPGGDSFDTIQCGKNISLGNVCLCQNISLYFDCGCNLDECEKTYTWEITGPNAYQLSGGPQTSGNISFIPTEPGVYGITVKPKCGDTVCPPCKVNVTVQGIVLCN
ncbi:MAG: hypothetical protein PVH61_23910 [Candidatus Aminicenantes bacterium]